MSKLNNYTESLREANEINRNLLKKLVETENQLKQYESGHKGACPTCEAVGEANVELEQKLEKAVDGLKFYADKDSWLWDEFAHELIRISDLEEIIIGNYIENFGGKRARQILKELGERWRI